MPWRDTIYHRMDSSSGAGKTLVDLAAGSTAVVTLLDYLPAIAAALSILWMLIRFYEYYLWVKEGRKGNGP